MPSKLGPQALSTSEKSETTDNNFEGAGESVCESESVCACVCVCVSESVCACVCVCE